MSTGNDIYINRFENKGQPGDIPETKIVEAYGLRKCPKLVGQIAGSILEVRQNALAVLCEEFKNPYSVTGCADEGVIKVLSQMVNDPDFTTRVRTTKALALAATDAKGLSAILFDEAIPQILNGINDPADMVRGNVYDCLSHVSSTAEGAHACVENGVTRAFVAALMNEDDSLKAVMLKTIYNMVGCEQGLVEAITSNAVQHCISLLSKSVEYSKSINAAVNGKSIELNYSPYEPAILSEAARALGFMCFDGRAKLVALDNGAVEQLIGLLKYKTDASSDVRSSVSISLMAISITDEGKKQIYNHQGVDNIIAMLYDDSKIVLLNTLKIISNIAIYPKTRELLLEDSTCCIKLKKLTKVDDRVIPRHAQIALDAVNWKP